MTAWAVPWSSAREWLITFLSLPKQQVRSQTAQSTWCTIKIAPSPGGTAQAALIPEDDAKLGWGGTETPRAHYTLLIERDFPLDKDTPHKMAETGRHSRWDWCPATAAPSTWR